MRVLECKRILFISENEYSVKPREDISDFKRIEPRVTKILVIAEIVCVEYRSILYCRHSFYV